MNPLLPARYCIPDAEARAMPDGRLYLYGSFDIPGKTTYCSDRYHVFSTDKSDLTDFCDHGVSFTIEEAAKGGFNPRTALFAPDCVYRNGKYWLYFCTSDNREGVAVSGRPEGPFTDATELRLPHNAIDPAVFVDEDGQAYYFWGQFDLHGAKLNDDMRSIDESTHCPSILNEREHGFHEGASIRRRGDLYYMLYTDVSRGRATCISYATATSPLGPYTKQGVIIDNTGCDPQSWNNHGSMEPYGDRWFVFYHRSSRNGFYSRRVSAEEIFFDAEGRIAEVIPTSVGGEPVLPMDTTLPAAMAARMWGDAYVEGETVRNLGGVPVRPEWVEYRSFDLTHAKSLALTGEGAGEITVHTEGNEVLAKGSFRGDTLTLTLKPTVGAKPIWICVTGKIDLHTVRLTTNE
ncbi:MAG: family 43 glycosylhydrolase [Clostridia bacterium]|nr:family 43 glycosylhydrolase [Clostridia bacterium]